MKVILRFVFLLIPLFVSSLSFALSNPSNPMNLWQQWTFSGVAVDEAGHSYYYYFVFQQQGLQRIADVLVLSEKLEPIIRYQKLSNNKTNQPVKTNSWKLGRTFFRYNPITQSWVFGIKAMGNIGFNFRADIQKKDGDMGERQSVAKGLDVEMNQFQQLNGHVFFSQDNQERFVSGKRGWLRYIEASNPPEKLAALLCIQSDDSGLYSLQYDSPQANKASIVGCRNHEGERKKVSQFISLKNLSDQTWKLTIPSPKTDWSLNLISRFMNDPFQTIIMANESGKKPAVCYYQIKNNKARMSKSE